MILSGCSFIRKGTRSEEPVHETSSVSVNLVTVGGLNVSNKGFFISKAEVTVSGEGIDQEILCTVKYSYGGAYLISLRSKAGIEAARLFISSDTVLVNDRINRKFYYGSNEILSEKYGFSYETICLIFGDYLSGMTDAEFTECDKGLLVKRSQIDKTLVEYTIDCTVSKAIFASAGRNRELILKYSGFKKYENSVIPENVEIVDKLRHIRILLKIDKIDYPWEGVVEFIPGTSYERIPLI